jgi:glyoxylase-like metal-dependent hydrolase (beta-lactamase superfamily II)
MKMHVLSGGRLKMRKGVYVPEAPREEWLELPVSCVLLRHAQGNVLFDTGCSPAAALDGEARWGRLARAMVPIFAPEDTVVAQLPKAGLSADDIDLVICSHLHADHCGCNAAFGRATVMVHADELAAAQSDTAVAQGYFRSEWDHGNTIDAFTDQRDVFGDGRITLLPMPGHTVGMTVARIALEHSGEFILASDAVPIRAALDQRYAPKNSWDIDKATAAVEEIARMEQGGATVLFGHDLDQWNRMKTGADCYD